MVLVTACRTHGAHKSRVLLVLGRRLGMAAVSRQASERCSAPATGTGSGRDGAHAFTRIYYATNTAFNSVFAGATFTVLSS
eukprot:5470245-Pleurochrysis_carterae.AAC.5